MKQFLILAIMLFCINALAVVHKFSPEFQAIYDEATRPEVQKALRKGAMAKIIYRIVDDEGGSVSNVSVNIEWQNDYPRKTWYDSLCSDERGYVEISEKVGGRMRAGFHKDGYYSSFDKIDFHWRKGVSPVLIDGKWQPYGENRTIVLKRIKNPIDLKVTDWGGNIIRAPITNVWIGLDLENGQWCKPFGTGEHDDVLVRFSGVVIDKFTWNTKTEISFTNVPYAGYYEMSKDGYSDMKSCYTASKDSASYVSRTMTFISRGAWGIPPNQQTTDKLADDKYIVFRTRCIVDDNGNLVSAHYGKLMGEFNGGGLALAFRCTNGDQCGIFFNTTHNDTNLEDMQTINRFKLLRR